MLKIVVEGQVCRICGNVPEMGYFKSRAEKKDWVCPRCSNKQRADLRVKNKRVSPSDVSYAEGGGHD